jgi:hypothetical protein
LSVLSSVLPFSSFLSFTLNIFVNITQYIALDKQKFTLDCWSGRKFIHDCCNFKKAARGSGTALQAGRSRVRFSMV